MNYSKAVFLINDKVRAVACTYGERENETPVLFKTLDETIAKDDFVIVPTDTRHKMTVVKVVNTEVEVDFDAPDQMKWIIGVVDVHDFKQITEQEDRAIAAVKSAELRRKRDELSAALFKDHAEKLKALELAHSSDAPPAAPAA